MGSYHNASGIFPAYKSETSKSRYYNMHAVIQTGGKQYRVSEGDTLFIEKLPDATEGKEVKFEQVIAVFHGENAQFGTPTVKGASVTAEVLKTGKAKKIVVFKRKRRKNYSRKQGHRQPFTEVEIKSIVMPGAEGTGEDTSPRHRDQKEEN